MMCNTSLDTVVILLVLFVLCVNNKEATVSQDFKGNFIRVAWPQSVHGEAEYLETQII